ncbi:MAG: hypothetical protein V7605_1956 [Acidimicrobiaceae bacterium]|jgi:hypothetical protein
MSSRRRRRPGPRPVPLLVINGLADAVAAAAGLCDRFAHGHGVAVTDRLGGVVDLVVFTEVHHTAEDAIRAGIAIGSHHPLARRAVLLSVLDGVDIATPNELEVEMWHRAVNRFSRAGLELSEWVIASGEVFRSLAITAETEHEWRPG